MKFLDLTLPGAAANLALDEALLDACENGGGCETLRCWEPQENFVVVGYGNHVQTEVEVEKCQADGVGIFRRCSGGGTILQGPGSLNYSLILRIDRDSALQTITGANSYIMGRNRDALAKLSGQPVKVAGHTDLAVDGVKFSGNAQRRHRHALLFHGTLLLNFDLGVVAKYLRMPSREPDYRQGRSHREFLMNLSLNGNDVKEALRKMWLTDEPSETVPEYTQLVTQKYSREEWNFKF